MNLEEVVRLQPDYLVFAASHSSAAAHDFDALSVLPGWQLLDAVRTVALRSSVRLSIAPRRASFLPLKTSRASCIPLRFRILHSKKNLRRRRSQLRIPQRQRRLT